MSFQQIRAYDNYVHANLALGMLQEAGINCHIKDEYTITIDPLLSPAIGGMKLMVLIGDVPKALSLLQESDLLYLQGISCPVCKQHKLQKLTQVKTFNSFIGKIKSLLVNGQEQEVKTYYRCSHCGSRFYELPAGND